MFEKIKEIAEAIYISYTPSENQKKLAVERYKICLSCPNYGEKREITGDEYCKICFCNIKKKVYSTKFDACPESRWIEVEKKILEDIKTKKTLT